MPTGAELIQMILAGGLTGRAMAGMQPPEALQGLGNVGPTPPFLPPNVGPILGGGGPTLPTPNLPPLPIPGGAGSGAMAIPPQSPIDFNAALERAQSAATGILGPETAPVQEKPNVLGLILQILSQGVTAGLSRNPGETLAEFQRQGVAQQQQKVAQRQQERERRQGLTAQIYSGEVAESRRVEAEQRREARESERDWQRLQEENRRILGDQTFRANEAELRRIFEEERERRKGEVEAAEQKKKDQAQALKDVQTQANTFTDDFRVPRPQARRFAEFEIMGTPLSAADQKVYARIEKYRPSLESGGGGGRPSMGVREKLAQFETMKGQLGAARERGDNTAEQRILRNLDNLAASMPSNIEVGYDPTGTWPYAKLRGTTPTAPAPIAKQAPQQAAESPQRAQARAVLKKGGYSDAEATKELNRMGIN